MKEAKEKWLVTYKGTISMRQSVDFFSRNIAGQKRVGWYIQNTERKKLPRIQYLAKLSFKNKWKRKSFPRKQKGKQKLREFVTPKPTLHEMAKGVLQIETKTC